MYSSFVLCLKVLNPDQFLPFLQTETDSLKITSPLQDHLKYQFPFEILCTPSVLPEVSPLHLTFPFSLTYPT